MLILRRLIDAGCGFALGAKIMHVYADKDFPYSGSIRDALFPPDAFIAFRRLSMRAFRYFQRCAALV